MNDDSEPADDFEIDFDLVGVIKRRYHLIILGTLVGATLATIYYVKQIPVYESHLAVLIGHRSGEITNTSASGLSDKGNTLQQDILSTHIELFKSPKILQRAVEIGGLNRSVSDLFANLTVSKGSDGASLLTASYRDHDPEAAARILQAIFDGYASYIDNQSDNVGLEAADLIAKAQVENEVALRQADEDYRAFVQSVPAFVVGGGQFDEVHRNRLNKIEGELGSIRSALAEAESRRLMIYDFVKGKRPADITDAEVLSLLSDKEVARLQTLIGIANSREIKGTDNNPLANVWAMEATRAYQRVLDLSSKREVLAASVGQGHPSVATIDAEIESLKQYQVQDQSENVRTEHPVFDVPPVKILETYYSVLRTDINEFKKQESRLLALSEQESKLAKEVEMSFLKGTALKANLDRAQRRYDEVFKLLQEINLTNDYTGFSTDMIVMPLPASLPIWPNRAMIAALGILAGALLGLAMAGLAEMADRTFHNPGEVERVVGASILAHVPLMRQSRLKRKVDNESAISPMIVAYHLPRGSEAETFRVMRTSVLFMNKKQSKQVFMLTSPSPSDGKSTAIANLAVSMAQTGKRVLLIDADLRRPTVATTLGVQRSPGLTDYLLNESSLEQCIQPCEQANLSIVAAGSRTSEPSELLESERFDELITQARCQFDVVFIDTPPVLAVADPAIVAMSVDSCLLAVRIEKNNRTLVERAAEIMRDQSTPIDGIIVNSRDSLGGGYGYASYNYYGKKEYGYMASYRRYYEADEDNETDAVSVKRITRRRRSSPQPDQIQPDQIVEELGEETRAEVRGGRETRLPANVANGVTNEGVSSSV